MRRLPPLTALRVFEAVGRGGNVRAAAQELNVTPAAVSHQIRLLEEHLGVELFIRSNRGLSLTQAGTQFYHDVSEAFDRLAGASRKLPGMHARTVRVHSLPSFASCWLVPRLAKFHALYPSIEVEINTVGDLGQSVDLANVEADLAIRVATSAHVWSTSGLKPEKLMHEVMFPVCTPDFAANAKLESPRDLASHTLLHVSRRTEGWPEWLAAAKALGQEICEIDAYHGPKFDTIQLTFAAAAEGMGVAMGRLPLVEDYIRNGTLIEVFSPLRVVSQNAYWLLSAANAPLPEGAAKLRAWMRAELDLQDN